MINHELKKYIVYKMEFRPHFGDVLPVAGVNMPNPPKVGLSSVSRGTRTTTNQCLPYVIQIGRPHMDRYVLTPCNRLSTYQEQREIRKKM